MQPVPRLQSPSRTRTSISSSFSLGPQSLVQSLTDNFAPEKYHDDYREQVLDLIEKKAAGEEFEVPEPAAEKPKIVDLMAALEASVEAAKSSRGRHPAAKKATSSSAKAKAKKSA